MRQRLNLILLGVRDVAASVAFYQALGWRRSTAGSDEFALFELGGVAVAFQSREAFAADAGLPDREPGGFAGFALAYVARSAEEVYQVMAKAAELGATVTRPAGPNPWGHSGYFTDPDGHLFEVLYEDGWIFDEHDDLVL
ncbi:VOC family protein [Streptosporangium carneum]|nr:VOC family protein [Streptosporangium carneum]